MTTTAPNKLDHVVGHNPFAIWRLKKKKKVYKHELNRVKVHAHSFSISFICSKVKLVFIPGIIIQNWFHFCLPTIPRSLKVVKYTTKKMGRCKTNVWSSCNTASQYFNDYTCQSHNWILLRLLHVYEFRIFVVFFQLRTAFSSTNKSSQFCPVFRGFLFSKKKKKLLKTMENCLRVSLRYPGWNSSDSIKIYSTPCQFKKYM